MYNKILDLLHFESLIFDVFNFFLFHNILAHWRVTTQQHYRPPCSRMGTQYVVLEDRFYTGGHDLNTIREIL